MSAQNHLVRLAQGAGAGPTDLIRLCLFDWAVCAIAGRQEDGVLRLLQSVENPGSCSVFGAGTFDVATAALINGTMGHALDYDDTHFDHIGHTSAVVMPAVLALAQDQMLTDTNRVLEAALAGSEAAVRTGLWLGRGHYQIGFHQTATAGAFGATIGLARLLRLERGQISHAIGLCATMASGLKGQFGTMGKPMNAGLAARVAIEAVIWARAGITADPEGLKSFAATHHGADDDTAWNTEEPWKIKRISHKFHACCHGLHAMIEAIGGADLAATDVAAVIVHTHPRWLAVCNQPAPTTGLGVKFSFRHTAAMALARIDTAGTANYSDATAQDAGLIALRDLVQVVGDTGLSEMQSLVRITRKDGSQTAVSHDLNAPLSLATRQQRLRAKADAVVGARNATALWQAVNSGDMIALFDVV